MLGEPDPTMSHSLRGLPGRLFSMQITDVGGHAALRRRAPLLAVRRSLGGGAGKAARVSAGTATGMFLDDPAGDVVETPAAAGTCSPGSKVDACVGPETAPSRQSRMTRLFPQTIQSLRRRRGSRPHAPSRIFSLLTSFNPSNGCCMRHRKPPRTSAGRSAGHARPRMFMPGLDMTARRTEPPWFVGAGITCRRQSGSQTRHRLVSGVADGSLRHGE
jgi:hypothetical protein